MSQIIPEFDENEKEVEILRLQGEMLLDGKLFGTHPISRVCLGW